MRLQFQPEGMTERLHPLVTCSDPLGAEFTNKVGRFRKRKRKDTASDAIASLEYRHVPTGALKHRSGSQAGKPGPNDDARMCGPRQSQRTGCDGTEELPS